MSRFMVSVLSLACLPPACLPLAVHALPTDEVTPQHFSRIEAGVICDITLDSQRPAPGTVSGVLNVVEQGRQIDVASTLVPAEIGLSFGIRAQLAEDAPGGTYTVIVTHPPMGDNGQTIETWEGTLAPGDPALNLFTFELPYELVEGDWRFQMALDGEIALQRDFTVLPKGSVPAVQQTCYGSQIMS